MFDRVISPHLLARTTPRFTFTDGIRGFLATTGNTRNNTREIGGAPAAECVFGVDLVGNVQRGEFTR